MSSSAAPPTLCGGQEKIVLTARLWADKEAPAEGREQSARESAVSLCLDDDARVPQLVLRIRQAGAGDVVIRSGPKRKFHTFSTEDGPHSGRDVIWVRSGPTEYCLSAAYAQGRGVGLDIFTQGQWRHRLFSGIEAGLNYEVADDAVLQGKVKSLLRKSRLASCV